MKDLRNPVVKQFVELEEANKQIAELQDVLSFQQDESKKLVDKVADLQDKLHRRNLLIRSKDEKIKKLQDTLDKLMKYDVVQRIVYGG